MPPYSWNVEAAGVIGLAQADGDCFSHRCEVRERGSNAHYTVEAEDEAESLKVEGRAFHEIELASHPSTEAAK